MAVYKVPQDVEADDKLIGPFSFRQFIYLIIVAISIAIGWGLFMLFPPLMVIPLPIILFFGALALPLRKDQPMEIYMAAVVSYFLRPRRRLWQPDGIQSLVEITAPKFVEVQRAKNLSQSEAQQRLSYLADIVDTGGWAVRGVAAMPEADSSMRGDVYFEAQQTQDILDDQGGVSQLFSNMIDQSDAKRRQEMVNKMHQTPAPAPQSPQTPQIPDPYSSLTLSAPQTPLAATSPDPVVSFNPYPNSMHQSVIRPLSEQPVVPATPTPSVPAQLAVRPSITSEKPVSPDIINLANNPDLSIETIAHEANRIRQKEESTLDDEVVISLR